MNDLTPPKSAQLTKHDISVSAADKVVTNVHPKPKTRVGKPVRRWLRRASIALVVIGVIAVSYSAFTHLSWRKLEPVKAVPGARKISDPRELKQLKEAPGQPLAGTE